MVQIDGNGKRCKRLRPVKLPSILYNPGPQGCHCPPLRAVSKDPSLVETDDEGKSANSGSAHLDPEQFKGLKLVKGDSTVCEMWFKYHAHLYLLQVLHLHDLFCSFFAGVFVAI